MVEPTRHGGNYSMIAGMTRTLSGRLAVMLVVAMLMTIMSPAIAADTPKLESVVISSLTNLAGDLHINAGKAEGVTVGAEGAVLRDGKEIAKYRVVDVNWGVSRISVYDLQSGYTVKAGDQAPVRTSVQTTKSKPSTWKVVGAILGIGLIAALVSGGGGGSKGPSASDITVTIQKNSTSTADGDVTSTATISAKIDKANGEPIPDGTAAIFSTTAGTLNVTQTRTVAGVATAVLTYNSAIDTAPEAKVTIRCAGKTQQVTISFTSSIELTADNKTIQAVGSGGAITETTVRATCRDILGNPVTSGNVKFTTNIGHISDTAAIGAGGVASAVFTSGTPGKAAIRATYSNSAANLNITIQAGPPSSIVVTSNKDTLASDGNSFARITADVKDAAGNPVTDGTVVNFSVEPDGGGGGNGTITDRATTTGGRATASLVTKDAGGVKSLPGVATVKAQVLAAGQPSTILSPAADLQADVTVNFISTTVASVSLDATKKNIRGLDVVGNTTNLIVIVSTSDGHAVADDTTVTFTTNRGSISNVTKTYAGQATAVLTGDSSGGDGIATVTATAGGVTSAPLTIIFSGAPSAANCNIEIFPATLAKSGGSATITVTARDINNHPVVDNTPVTIVTSKGFVEPISNQTNDGVAAFTLRTSADAESPTEPGDGTVTATISAGGTGSNVILTKQFTVTP